MFVVLYWWWIWILFMLGTLIDHRGFVHIKHSLALCQNRVFCHNCYVFCDIPHMNRWMLFIFGIVTMYMYGKSQMHVRSKLSPHKNRLNWRILAWTARVNPVMTSLVVDVDPGFWPTWGQNHHKAGHKYMYIWFTELWVLKFNSIHYHKVPVGCP